MALRSSQTVMSFGYTHAHRHMSFVAIDHAAIAPPPSITPLCNLLMLVITVTTT